MTTALATLSNTVAQLTPYEELVLGEAAGETDAYDHIPTKITINPGGTNIFMTSDGEALKVLTGIIVVSQKARAYWPEKGSGQPPMCASFDGAHGVLAGEPTDSQYQAAMGARIPHPAIPLLTEGGSIPATFACATCPMAQFGSAHQGGGSGRGAACKALRRLVLAVDGWAQPALFTLPPTSIKNFDLYASGLARQRGAYFAVRTKITLEAQRSAAGDPYSTAAFSIVGKLTEEELRAVLEVRTQFASLVRSMPIEASEYDTTGGNASVNGNGYAAPDDADNENPF